MLQHPSKSAKGAKARRKVRLFPRSKADKPRFDGYQAILRIFRQRILLLEILQCRRAPPGPGGTSEAAIDTRNPNLEIFLNQLSWLCDHGTGGDSTSSIAIEATPRGLNYWLAANFDPRTKIREHLETVLDSLDRLKTLPWEMNRPVLNEILKTSLEFSKEKFKYYKKCLNTAMHYAKASKTQDSLDAKFLEEAEKLSHLEEPLDLSICAYKLAMTPLLRKLHRKHREQAPKDAGSAWYEICHYVGRLGSWVRSILVLVHFVRKHPQVLENFTVHFLPAPGVLKHVKSKHRPKLQDVLREILPKDRARAEKLYERLKNFRAFDFEAAFTKKCKSKHSRYAARSHSELILLDHFQRNGLSFFQNAKFVASSKGSCYCCNLFFHLHNSDIATRPTHGNAWSRWCIPPGLEREDKRLFERGEVTILERMTKRISLDIIQLIETGVPRRVRFKDSTTGIWTAPIWGLSAM